MKLHAEIEGRKHEVEVKRIDGEVTAMVDGREYHLSASEPEPNIFLLKHDNKIFETSVSPTDASNFVVNLRGHDFEVKIMDPKRLRGSGGEHLHGDGAAEIKTAMPGKVVRILKSVGDSVAKAEGVIVVEAMKMQNEMKSPKDGTISEIKFAEGDTVSAGDVLVVIE